MAGMLMRAGATKIKTAKISSGALRDPQKLPAIYTVLRRNELLATNAYATQVANGTHNGRITQCISINEPRPQFLRWGGFRATRKPPWLRAWVGVGRT